MLKMITGFLGVNKYMMIVGALVISSFVVVIGIEKYKVSKLETAKALLEQKIIVQDFQIDGLKGEIRVKDFTAKLLREDKAVLDQRRKDVETANSKLNNQLEDIHNEPETQDGAVAPVLRNVLSSR